MIKSKDKEILTLDDVILERAELEKRLAAILAQQAELSTKELHKNLSRACDSLDKLAVSQRYTREVKVMVRKLHRSIIGKVKVKVAPSETKTTKEDKKKCVASFLDKLTGEFTMPSLKDHAKKQGIEVSGSTEQYFRAALDGKAQVVMRNGKAKKYGVAKIWKKK